MIVQAHGGELLNSRREQTHRLIPGIQQRDYES
jgi:hypothetical protein